MASIHDKIDFGEDVNKVYYSEVIIKRIYQIHTTENTCVLCNLNNENDKIFNVPFFYHCPGEQDVGRGKEAFSQWDHVLVLKEIGSTTSYSVVGHADPIGLSSCQKPYLFVHYYDIISYPTLHIENYGKGFVWDCYANKLANGIEFGPKVGLPPEPINWPVDSTILSNWKDNYGENPPSATIQLPSPNYPLEHQEKYYNCYYTFLGNYGYPSYGGYGSMGWLDPGIYYYNEWDTTKGHPVKIIIYTKMEHFCINAIARFQNNGFFTANSTIQKTNTNDHTEIPRAHKFIKENLSPDIYKNRYYLIDMFIGINSGDEENRIKVYWDYDETEHDGLISQCNNDNTYATAGYGWIHCNWWYKKNKVIDNINYGSIKSIKDIPIFEYGYGSRFIGKFYKRYMFQISLFDYLHGEVVGNIFDDDPPIKQQKIEMTASSNVFDDLAFYHNPKEQERNIEFEGWVQKIIDSVIESRSNGFNKNGLQAYFHLL